MPVATELVGEVWPVVVRVGELTDFTYALSPTIASEDAGFDRLEIRSLSVLGEIRDVRIGDVSVDFTMEAAEPHRLALGIPRLDSGDSGALVEVDFGAQVLLFGTGFEARVWNSEQPLEVPQGVSPGDATSEFEGNRITVATSQADEGELLHLRIDRSVLTPNGDGANDHIRLTYEILEITGQASVRVEVRDLSGRRVRLLHEGTEGIDSYEWRWDGRDDFGKLLPPEVYLATVSADTDRDHVKRTKVLHVVH